MLLRRKLWLLSNAALWAAAQQVVGGGIFYAEWQRRVAGELHRTWAPHLDRKLSLTALQEGVRYVCGCPPCLEAKELLSSRGNREIFQWKVRIIRASFDGALHWRGEKSHEGL